MCLYLNLKNKLHRKLYTTNKACFTSPVRDILAPPPWSYNKIYTAVSSNVFIKKIFVLKRNILKILLLTPNTVAGSGLKHIPYYGQSLHLMA